MNMNSMAWRRAFADALIRLRPDLNPDAVDELSDAAWLRLSNLAPAVAAERCSRRGGLPEPQDDRAESLPS